MNLDITGYHMVAGLGGMLCTIVVMILILRQKYHRSTGKKLSEKWSERTKYAVHDVFKDSPIYFRIGLICSMLITILAFNYTNYEKKPSFEFVYEIEDTIENTPPITRENKRLPPPPPPAPKLEDIIAIDDVLANQVEFIDQKLENPIVEPPAAKGPPADDSPTPPPPLPEPPPIPKGPIIASEIMPRMCTSCENENLTRNEKNKCASKEMFKFVLSQLKYPTLAREVGIQGVCPVKFVINSDGTISNIELLKDIGAGCGKEALRVTSMLKEKCWLPGRQNGQRVSVQMVLPIRFKLD